MLFLKGGKANRTTEAHREKRLSLAREEESEKKIPLV